MSTSILTIKWVFLGRATVELPPWLPVVISCMHPFWPVRWGGPQRSKPRRTTCSAKRACHGQLVRCPLPEWRWCSMMPGRYMDSIYCNLILSQQLNSGDGIFGCPQISSTGLAVWQVETQASSNGGAIDGVDSVCCSLSIDVSSASTAPLCIKSPCCVLEHVKDVMWIYEVVFGTMVDQIRSVVLLVLVNYFILALWRVFGRPTILMSLGEENRNTAFVNMPWCEMSNNGCMNQWQPGCSPQSCGFVLYHWCSTANLWEEINVKWSH